MIAIDDQIHLPVEVVKMRERWLIRDNPGVQHRQPGLGKTEKTEFTGAGISVTLKFSSGRQTDDTYNRITMKIKTITMSLAFSLCALASFAFGNENKKAEPLPFRSIVQSVSSAVITGKAVFNKCTVSIKYGKTITTVTASCDCTMKEACEAAYKLAAVPI